MSIWSEAFEIIPALLSGDPYEMKTAFQSRGAWLFTFFVTLLSGLFLNWIYKKIPWVERNLERGIIVYTYLIIAGIIFWGVIDRFVFSHQVPWSTTIPPLLFMLMAWYGCSYNIKLRTHLSFNEFRGRLPRKLQFSTLILDGCLWFGFAWIGYTTTTKATINSASNFQIVLGTDNMMQWWFIGTIPIAFLLMAGRVIANIEEDIQKYRAGQALINQAVIGGDV